MSSVALEKHFRVRELAALWGFSDNTVIRLFESEAGVIRLESDIGKRNTPRCRFPKALRYVFTRDSATSRSRRSLRVETHFA